MGPVLSSQHKRDRDVLEQVQLTGIGVTETSDYKEQLRERWDFSVWEREGLGGSY